MKIIEEIFAKLEEARAKSLLRERVPIIKVKHDHSSNDYLSLAGSLRARFWLLRAILLHGIAKCSSKYLNGYTTIHKNLEQTVARACNAEDAVVFSSGYLASIGTLQGLCNTATIILADRHIHASWIDAAFAVRARIIRFHHNSLTHLEELLQKYRASRVIIITESVFSMQGTVVDLKEYERIASHFGCILISDNAHGLGVLPCFKIAYRMHIQVGTFSKACAGFGGYACGEETLIKAIASFGRTQIYSTVLPEYMLYFNTLAFKFAVKNAGKILKKAEALGVKHGMSYHNSAILIKQFESIEEARLFQEKLLKEGVYAPVVRPPTVPKPIVRLSVKL